MAVVASAETFSGEDSHIGREGGEHVGDEEASLSFSHLDSLLLKIVDIQTD